MLLFRISRNKYASKLDGEGARLAGGRWSRKGTAIIHSSVNRSLAILEYLIHTNLKTVPPDVSLVTLEVPDSMKTAMIKVNDLPTKWDKYPHPDELKDIGTDWARSKKTVLLSVPSALLGFFSDEYNILINPVHEDMSLIHIESITDLSLDNRFFS